MTEPRSLEERVLLLEKELFTIVAELHGLKLGTAIWMMERLPNVPPMDMLAPVMRERFFFKGAIDKLRKAGGPWQIFAKTLESYDQQIANIRKNLEAAWAQAPRKDLTH